MPEVVSEALGHSALVPGVVAGHPGHALASLATGHALASLAPGHALASLAPGLPALAHGVVGPSGTLTSQAYIGRTGGTCGVGCYHL